jgi:hypothetical protein
LVKELVHDSCTNDRNEFRIFHRHRFCGFERSRYEERRVSVRDTAQ